MSAVTRTSSVEDGLIEQEHAVPATGLAVDTVDVQDEAGELLDEDARLDARLGSRQGHPQGQTAERPVRRGHDQRGEGEIDEEERESRREERPGHSPEWDAAGLQRDQLGVRRQRGRSHQDCEQGADRDGQHEDVRHAQHHEAQGVPRGQGVRNEEIGQLEQGVDQQQERCDVRSPGRTSGASPAAVTGRGRSVARVASRAMVAEPSSAANPSETSPWEAAATEACAPQAFPQRVRFPQPRRE